MCERLTLPDGSVAIVCGLRRSRKRCAHPACRSRADVECDYLDPATGKTCDRPTCRAHAKPIAADVDWCWRCVQQDARAPRLAGL